MYPEGVTMSELLPCGIRRFLAEGLTRGHVHKTAVREPPLKGHS
jgi:hypothetical protein